MAGHPRDHIGDRSLATDGHGMVGLPDVKVLQALVGSSGMLHRLTHGDRGCIVEVNAPIVTF